MNRYCDPNIKQIFVFPYFLISFLEKIHPFEQLFRRGMEDHHQLMVVAEVS